MTSHGHELKCDVVAVGGNRKGGKIHFQPLCCCQNEEMKKNDFYMQANRV